MKLSVRFVLPGLLFVAATSTTFASVQGSEGQGWGPGNSSGNGTGAMNELTKYLKNLGAYLGYSIATDPSNTTSNPPVPYQALLDPVSSQNAPNTLIDTNFNAVAAFLAGSFTTITTPTIGQIVSTALKNSNVPTVINSYANFSYNPNSSSGASSSSSTYGTPGNETGISVNPLIDQSGGTGVENSYQSDPVSQGILNILSTPDYSYCMDNLEKSWLPCQYNLDSSTATNSMNEYQVMASVLGTSLPKAGGPGGGAGAVPLPGQYDYFQPANIQPYLGQLNVNSLITPMMYSTSLYPNRGQGVGLQAYNDVQQAENFIRYVTGAVTPMTLPDRNAYNKLVGTTQDSTQPLIARVQANATIVSYLTSIRTHAAQMSVGLGNLYYIMSKRIPITNNPYSAGSNNSPSSQALSEFNMATWRLFNPASNAKPNDPTAWIMQINKASPATVQKEMAVLLAEINYQLYLNRQQEERLLLTNSLIILQNAKAAQPSPLLNAPNTGTAGTSGSMSAGS